MQPKKFEEYPYFQPVAWTIVLVFTIFVLAISVQTRNIINVIQMNNSSIDQRLQALEKNSDPKNEDNSSAIIPEDLSRSMFEMESANENPIADDSNGLSEITNDVEELTVE